MCGRAGDRPALVLWQRQRGDGYGRYRGGRDGQGKQQRATGIYLIFGVMGGELGLGDIRISIRGGACVAGMGGDDGDLDQELMLLKLCLLNGMYVNMSVCMYSTLCTVWMPRYVLYVLHIRSVEYNVRSTYRSTNTLSLVLY